MSNLAVYDGEVVDEREELRRKILQLENKLEVAKTDIYQVQKKSQNALRALDNLQRKLRPWYDTLREIFGDLDGMNLSSTSSMDSRVNGVWQSWIQKLPGKRADFIAALLEHGEMTGAQLRVATHTAAGSVAAVIHELKKLGLINKNGGKYSLKEL